MKTKFYLLSAVFGVFFISCSSDDSTQKEEEEVRPNAIFSTPLIVENIGLMM